MPSILQADDEWRGKLFLTVKFNHQEGNICMSCRGCKCCLPLQVSHKCVWGGGIWESFGRKIEFTMMIWSPQAAMTHAISMTPSGGHLGRQSCFTAPVIYRNNSTISARPRFPNTLFRPYLPSQAPHDGRWQEHHVPTDIFPQHPSPDAAFLYCFSIRSGDGRGPVRPFLLFTLVLAFSCFVTGLCVPRGWGTHWTNGS